MRGPSSDTLCRGGIRIQQAMRRSGLCIATCLPMAALLYRPAGLDTVVHMKLRIVLGLVLRDKHLRVSLVTSHPSEHPLVAGEGRVAVSQLGTRSPIHNNSTITAVIHFRMFCCVQPYWLSSLPSGAVGAWESPPDGCMDRRFTFTTLRPGTGQP